MSQTNSNPAWISKYLFEALMFLFLVCGLAQCHNIDQCTKACENPKVGIFTCECK